MVTKSLHKRLLLYPPALAVGALAVAIPHPQLQALLFLVFTALMVAPLVIKAAAASRGRVGRFTHWLTRRRLRTTREGMVFLVLTVLFGVAAINTGTNLLYLLLSLLLSMIVASGMLSELDVKGLRLMRRLPTAVFRGEPATLAVTVDNPRRFMPALILEVGEVSGPFGPGGERGPGPVRLLARLDPGEQRVVEAQHTFERRGVFQLEGFELRTRFPFGFFIKFARASLPAELVVYPAIRPIRRGALIRHGTEPGRRRSGSRLQRAGEEFRSLRPYRPGDSPRWIHWRSSARTGELQVREFEPRTARSTCIVVDACPGERAGEPAGEADRALDRVADVAASLAAALGAAGAAPETAITTPDAPIVPAGSGGTRPSARLLDALARLSPIDDHGCAQLVEAARTGLRRRADIYVITARDPKLVRGALTAAGANPTRLRVLEAATDPQAEAHFDSGPGEAKTPRRHLRLPAGSARP
jgi:uncharacterized protein (DUF58 family)